MKDKNKKNMVIVTIVIIIIVIISAGIIYASYGFVTSDILSEKGKGKYFVVENLMIEYSDGTEELVSKQNEVFIPGSIINKTFTVKNTGSKNINYNIVFSDIINNFNRKNDIVYELYIEDTLLSSGVFPNEKSTYIVGDINLDGIIDDEDCKRLERFINNSVSLTRLQLIASDLNLDNTVDKLDSPTLIKEYINNKNSENPKELETNIGIKKTVENIQTILDNQSLKINETQTFKLKLKYLTSEENQIEDSGKTINAKISFEQFSK